MVQEAIFKKYQKNIKDPIAIVFAAHEGVNAALFFELADFSGYKREQLAQVFHTSLKTLKRYEIDNKKLNAQESEAALKLLALFQKGKTIFGNTESFRNWLDKPAFGLGNQAPFGLLPTSGGMDLVMEELSRIEYGDLA